MSLLKNISENLKIGFSGRINILSGERSQFMGAVYLDEGMVVNAIYSGAQGERALKKLILDDGTGLVDFKVVVEPELISESSYIFKMNLDDFERFCELFLRETSACKVLKPGEGVKLMVSPSAVVSDLKLGTNEFKVLSLISDFSLVREIYQNTELFDFEVTNALVSLRKKGAIKVLGKLKTEK